MNVIIREKSVYISAAYVLFVQIVHCDVRIILEDHTGYNLVTHLQFFTCAVDLYVLTHLYDLSGSFMSKDNRDQAEWVSLEFMGVSTAYAASFNLYKNISVSQLRNREFFDIIVFQCCQHSHTSSFWNCLVSCCCICCRSSLFAQHTFQYLFNDCFYICGIHFHFISSCLNECINCLT